MGGPGVRAAVLRDGSTVIWENNKGEMRMCTSYVVGSLERSVHHVS